MRSATSSSKALLRSDLRRYWPVFFGYTFLWALALPLGLWRGVRWTEGTPIKLIFSNYIYNSMPGVVLAAAAMGVVLAMTVYGYLMKSNSVGLMHSLPISRTAQYFTHFGAGMAMTTAGNVVIVLIAALVELRLGAVEWKSLLCWWVVSELLVFFFFALSTLCATVTGWLLAIPVIFVGVNFMVKAYSLLLSAMGAAFYYGYSMRTEFTAWERWLTPIYNLFEKFANNYEYDPTLGYGVVKLPAGAGKMIAIYAALGVIALVLGWLFYRLRHSETAGDAIVFRWLKPIVRYVIAIAGGIGLGFGLYAILEMGNDPGAEIFLLVCQLVMGFVVYCAVEMLMRKRFKIFDRRTWIGLAVLFAIIIGVFGVMKLDLTGYEKRIPAAEDVKSIYVMGDELSSFGSDDSEVIELVRQVHQDCIDKKGQTAPNSPEEEQGFLREVWVDLEYTLKNGTHVNRQYYVPLYEGDKMIGDVNRLINSDIAKRENYLHGGYDALQMTHAIGGYLYAWDMGGEFQITEEQAEALRQAILYDIENLPDRDVTGPQAALLRCEIQLDMDDGFTIYLNEMTHDFAATEQILQEIGLFDMVDVTGPWELADRNAEADMIAAFGADYADAQLCFTGDSFELHIGDVDAVGTWERNAREVFATSFDSGEEVVYGFTCERLDGKEYLALDGRAVGAGALAIYWVME